MRHKPFENKYVHSFWHTDEGNRLMTCDKRLDESSGLEKWLGAWDLDFRIQARLESSNSTKDLRTDLDVTPKNWRLNINRSQKTSRRDKYFIELDIKNSYSFNHKLVVGDSKENTIWTRTNLRQFTQMHYGNKTPTDSDKRKVLHKSVKSYELVTKHWTNRNAPKILQSRIFVQILKRVPFAFGGSEFQ